MNYYKEYLAERESKSCFETPHGFAIYQIQGDECYLKDIYVQPEHRKHGYASRIADQISEIAKGRGCRWLVGSVSPPANNSHISLLVLLAYGMKLKRADKDIIYFYKEI